MGDFSLEQLLQVAVVILFFVLPGLKSVAEAKKVERERKAGKPARRAASKPKPEASGLDDWKRLLRGDLPLRPVRPPAAPPSAPTRPMPAPPRESLERSLEGRSLEGQSLEASGAGEGRVGERPRLGSELSPGELSPRLSPELASGAALAGLGSAMPKGSAAFGELAVGVPFGAAATFAPAGRRELPSGPGAWRHAVIAAEVLAPPLGLRGSWPGPPGSQYH